MEVNPTRKISPLTTWWKEKKSTGHLDSTQLAKQTRSPQSFTTIPPKDSPLALTVRVSCTRNPLTTQKHRSTRHTYGTPTVQGAETGCLVGLPCLMQWELRDGNIKAMRHEAR